MQLDATASEHGSRPDAAARATAVTSAIPAFLEAIGRLAAEAAARGELDRAMELLAQAARVAAGAGASPGSRTAPRPAGARSAEE